MSSARRCATSTWTTQRRHRHVRRVVDAVTQFFPMASSVHRGTGFKSRASTEAFEEARQVIGEFVGADLDHDVVVFTKNTTEAINLFARSMVLPEEAVVLTTVLEHHSNLLPWRLRSPVVHVRSTAGRLAGRGRPRCCTRALRRPGRPAGGDRGVQRHGHHATDPSIRRQGPRRRRTDPRRCCPARRASTDRHAPAQRPGPPRHRRHVGAQDVCPVRIGSTDRRSQHVRRRTRPPRRWHGACRHPRRRRVGRIAGPLRSRHPQPPRCDRHGRRSEATQQTRAGQHRRPRAGARRLDARPSWRRCPA